MFGMFWGICIQTSVNAAVQKENGFVQKNETINIFTKILNEQSNKKNGFVQKNKTVDTLTKISNKGQSLDNYNPYHLAQFPMGCQYKGYELCDPIYDPDELGDENIDRGGSYIYAPMTRLYFPDDYLSAFRESTLKTAEIDDYVGVWSPATRHDMDGEVKKLENGSLEVRIYADIYTCHDLIVKGRNYLVYFCRMDKESSVWQDTPKPAKEPYDAYLLLEYNCSEYDINFDISVEVSKHLPCLQFTPALEHYWNKNAYYGTSKAPICSSRDSHTQSNVWKKNR